jgi:hypothetical protein
LRHNLGATQQIMRRAAAERVPLVIRGMPYPCWNCAYEDVAVALIHVEDIVGVDRVITTENRLVLAYAAELLAAAGHPQTATIKARRSRTAKATYLSNGCCHCDALFGQFPVSEKLTEVLASDKVNTLPVLATVERSAIEWYALVGLSASSGNLE